MVKCLIEANNYTKIRLVSAGTKVFTRQEGGENKQSLDTGSTARQQFRILADAVSTLLPYFSRNTIGSGRKDDLKRLLESYHPLLSDFGESFRSQLVAKGNNDRARDDKCITYHVNRQWKFTNRVCSLH